MIEKLKELKDRYDFLVNESCKSEVIADMEKWKKITKEQNSLQEYSELYDEYTALQKSLSGAKEILESSDDQELKEIAETEAQELSEKISKLEDKIKLAFAQEHKSENITTQTWKSAEYLQFREEQLKPLNEAFTDFVNKAGNDGERFYDSQALNNVYQNNVSGKFRKEAGLNQPLWLRAANRLDVMNKEAVGEWLDGLGAGISPDGKKMNFLQKLAKKILVQN
jgi:hypothetical protein